MMTVRLGLGLLIADAGIAALQQMPQGWAENLFGSPANLTHDFGDVPCGAQPQHDFVIANIYAVPVEIVRIRAGGCASSSVRASLDKWTLQPGEKATIHMRMDTRRFIGKKAVSLWVEFGPGDTSLVKLTVTAISRDDLDLDPTKWRLAP